MRLSTSLFIATSLALTVAVSGCSASSESTTTVTTSVTNDDTTESTTSEVSTSVGTEGVSADANVTSSTTVNIDDWECGWIGTSSTDSTVYYAESPESDQAVLAIADANYDSLLSFVGPLSMDEDGISTVEDPSGNSFGFALLDQDGESATLDLGEEFGEVTLTPYEMPDFISALQEADVDGQLFAE